MSKVLPITLLGLLLLTMAPAQSEEAVQSGTMQSADKNTKKANDTRRRASAFYRPRSKPRPNRGRALRYENLTDIEAREIERVANKMNPGAIVNISGVTVGCPCEDGPSCTDQVWIVADNDQRSLGVMLSRIGQTWQVGPMQQWWLDREAINVRFRTAYNDDPDQRQAHFRRHNEELQQLIERFPVCRDEGE